MDKDFITIGTMATMHHISRQTLILYDHYGLFKPALVNDKGYRYYSLYQIPFLREICLMKEMGFSLEEIKESFENRTADHANDFYEDKLKKIKQEIYSLERKKVFLEQKLSIYDHLVTKQKNVNTPYIKWFPERKVIFVPFEKDSIEINDLHLTLMKAWNVLLKHDMVPSKGFGAMLQYDSVLNNAPLKNGGSIINLPFVKNDSKIENLYTIPEGEYATVYKYGMPYDTKHVYRLLDWIKAQGYKVTGNIIDLCLLDTTFYDTSHHVDFCSLQIPIAPINPEK